MHGPAATEQAVFLTTEATCATPEGIPYRALCDLVLYTSKGLIADMATIGRLGPFVALGTAPHLSYVVAEYWGHAVRIEPIVEYSFEYPYARPAIVWLRSKAAYYKVLSVAPAYQSHWEQVAEAANLAGSTINVLLNTPLSREVSATLLEIARLAGRSPPELFRLLSKHREFVFRQIRSQGSARLYRSSLTKSLSTSHAWHSFLQHHLDQRPPSAPRSSLSSPPPSSSNRSISPPKVAMTALPSAASMTFSSTPISFAPRRTPDQRGRRTRGYAADPSTLEIRLALPSPWDSRFACPFCGLIIFRHEAPSLVPKLADHVWAVHLGGRRPAESIQFCQQNVDAELARISPWPSKQLIPSSLRPETLLCIPRHPVLLPAATFCKWDDRAADRLPDPVTPGDAITAEDRPSNQGAVHSSQRNGPGEATTRRGESPSIPQEGPLHKRECGRSPAAMPVSRTLPLSTIDLTRADEDPQREQHAPDPKKIKVKEALADGGKLDRNVPPIATKAHPTGMDVLAIPAQSAASPVGTKPVAVASPPPVSTTAGDGESRALVMRAVPMKDIQMSPEPTAIPGDSVTQKDGALSPFTGSSRPEVTLQQRPHHGKGQKKRFASQASGAGEEGRTSKTMAPNGEMSRRPDLSHLLSPSELNAMPSELNSASGDLRTNSWHHHQLAGTQRPIYPTSTAGQSLESPAGDLPTRPKIQGASSKAREITTSLSHRFLLPTSLASHGRPRTIPSCQGEGSEPHCGAGTAAVPAAEMSPMSTGAGASYPIEAPAGGWRGDNTQAHVTDGALKRLPASLNASSARMTGHHPPPPYSYATERE